jgi:hypothetical protein
MRKPLSILLSASLLLGSIPKASANPALVAPAACATGVGCFVVGTIIVGGAIAYVWQNGGQKLVATASGKVLRILIDPEDPEGSMSVPENGGFFADNLRDANKRCIRRGFRAAEARLYPSGGTYYVCVR